MSKAAASNTSIPSRVQCLQCRRRDMVNFSPSPPLCTGREVVDSNPRQQKKFAPKLVSQGRCFFSSCLFSHQNLPCVLLSLETTFGSSTLPSFFLNLSAKIIVLHIFSFLLGLHGSLLPSFYHRKPV